MRTLPHRQAPDDENQHRRRLRTPRSSDRCAALQAPRQYWPGGTPARIVIWLAHANRWEVTLATGSGTRTSPVIPTGTWTVDAAHSAVGFSVKHMGIANVRGKFLEFEGTLEMKENLSDCRAYGTVMVASISTDEPQRDGHLRSADFFDADQFANITFEFTRVEAIDDESSRVTGNLTMHGITREIRLDVLIQGTDTDPWGNTRAGLEVVGKLNRSDFDMKFNQALGSGNVLVGDKVGISPTSRPSFKRADLVVSRPRTLLTERRADAGPALLKPGDAAPSPACRQPRDGRDVALWSTSGERGADRQLDYPQQPEDVGGPLQPGIAQLSLRERREGRVQRADDRGAEPSGEVEREVRSE